MISGSMGRGGGGTEKQSAGQLERSACPLTDKGTVITDRGLVVDKIKLRILGMYLEMEFSYLHSNHIHSHEQRKVHVRIGVDLDGGQRGPEVGHLGRAAVHVHFEFRAVRPHVNVTSRVAERHYLTCRWISNMKEKRAREVSKANDIQKRSGVRERERERERAGEDEPVLEMSKVSIVSTTVSICISRSEPMETAATYTSKNLVRSVT
jgi:hypothetical protein